MNPELTKLIEQFLAGELSSEDQKAFEDRMTSNETLRNAVSQQREIHAGAKRADQREHIEKIGKKYHFRKNFFRGGMSLLIVAVIATGSWLVYGQFIKDQIPQISEEVKAKLDELAPIDLAAQYFVIPEDGGIVLSEQGVLISVPEGAFTQNGKPYKDAVALQFQEALSGTDILKSGLSTTSNGELLETGGMISVTGFTIDGEPLDFNPKVGVYVQVPTKDEHGDMQLYDGERMADGSINWVKPEALEKIPVPVAMSELDFYPAGYEPYLNEQKWSKSKTRRDSLYLSFEEERNEGAYQSGKRLFEAKCATCHHPTKDGTGPALAGVRSVWEENGANEATIIQWVKNWQDAAATNAYARSRIVLKPTAMVQFGNQLSDEEIICILDYLDTFSGIDREFPDYPIIPDRKITVAERDYLYNDNRAIDNNMSIQEYARLVQWEDGPNYKELVGNTFYDLNIGDFAGVSDSIETPKNSTHTVAVAAATKEESYILPSKVLGFWKSEFNKTNLSTREFEQRMLTIHETCDNAVLDIYTNNLNRTIKYCDDKVVSMGYSEFSKYAAENVGKLKAGNPHVKQLQRFYDKSVKQLKNRNSILQKQERKRRDNHDATTRNSREKESKRSEIREAQAYNEEYEYNLDNVYAQLGKSRGFTITSSSKEIASTAALSAVKNIDRLVAEATTKRESTTIVDPETGKEAQLTYNDFSFEVKNSDKYIKLFAYVMPYELNSYQRINGTKGKFDHALNDDIRYNIAVVGVKENGFGFYKKLNIKGGKLGKIDLKEVSESKLNADVTQLNRQRNSNPMPIKDELVWLRQEQKDFTEQKLRQKMRVFRTSIMCIIFPCCCSTEAEGEAVEEVLSIEGLE